MTVVVKLKFLFTNSDIFGGTAALLCMAHCLATPFLFIVQAGHSKNACIGPTWWTSIDFVFLLIAGFAVFQSARNSVSSWLPFGLSFFFLLLAIGIIAPSLSLSGVGKLEILKWPGAIGLVIFHLVNRQYCHCADSSCCLDETIIDHRTHHFQEVDSLE